MRNGIKTIIVVLLLSTFMVSCSIYDKYPGHRQCDISLELADSTGAVLPDSIAHLYSINWFVDGIYQHTVAADADGKYRVSFDSGDRITFVAMAASDTSECVANSPVLGESIKNTWLQMKTSSNIPSPQPHTIYYGKLDVVPQDDDTLSKNYTILMKDVRAKFRVLIKGLKSRFGDGNYRIVVEGLRTGIAYDGSSTGEQVNYSINGAFNSDGNYITLPYSVFPTKEGERVRILVYKQDGTLLFDHDTDDNGIPLVLKRYDDVVFVITASYQAQLTITIVPWADIDNPVSFQ